MSQQTINSEHERNWLRWKATAVEWMAVIVAGVSTIISIISMFVVAILAGVVIAQNARIEELSDEIGVMEVYITQHKGKHNE